MSDNQDCSRKKTLDLFLETKLAVARTDGCDNERPVIVIRNLRFSFLRKRGSDAAQQSSLNDSNSTICSSLTCISFGSSTQGLVSTAATGFSRWDSHPVNVKKKDEVLRIPRRRRNNSPRLRQPTRTYTNDTKKGACRVVTLSLSQKSQIQGHVAGQTVVSPRRMRSFHLDFSGERQELKADTRSGHL